MVTYIVLARFTDQGVKNAKDKYCNAHPLADYIDAVMDLYKGFPENKNTKSK